MRRLPDLLLILPVLSLGVVALNRTAKAADPPAADPPAVSAPDAGQAQAHHARLTAEQHFTQANLAHDGHLTLSEAKGGYPTVARHFAEIDADHKGYVTEGDIRAWRTMHSAAQRMTKPPADRLRPHAAFQPGCPDLRAVSASGSQTINQASGSTPEDK